MNDLKFREYDKSDAPYLEEIIRKTWQYDLFCGPKVSKRMGKIYLLGCLSQQSFTQVALLDNQPVGVIMCADKRTQKTPLWVRMRQIRASISLGLSKEGRTIGRIFGAIDGVDEQLLQTQSKLYDGELVFFAVSAENRGTGIGKALFEKALAYMQREEIEDFYLYTDTTCNYAFYERQGMIRVGEKTYQMPIKTKSEMTFYLYEYGRENEQ